MFRAAKRADSRGHYGMEPKYVVVFFWVSWFLSWWRGTNTAKLAPIAKHAASRRELPYRLVQGIGFTLLVVSLGLSSSADPLPPLRKAILNFGFAQLWEPSAAVSWVAAALAAVGFAFAWWGRIQLGEWWSSGVAIREGHKLVDKGPYAIVRHPICVGMLVGAVALLLISGRTFGVIGFVFAVAGLILKARLEEAFLTEELGANVYGAYAKRVPALVPGL